MIFPQLTTPAHRLFLCAGVFVMCLAGAACENAGIPEGDRTLELANDTIVLPPGVNLHDVAVRTGNGYKDFTPADVQAKPGDYLRFKTADNRTHSLVLEAATPEQKAFLESKNQLRSPPLVSNGASWVVVLQDAPAGTYVFRCQVHNDSGRLVVGDGRR